MNRDDWKNTKDFIHSCFFTHYTSQLSYYIVSIPIEISLFPILPHFDYLSCFHLQIPSAFACVLFLFLSTSALFSVYRPFFISSLLLFFSYSYSCIWVWVMTNGDLPYVLLPLYLSIYLIYMSPFPLLFLPPHPFFPTSFYLLLTCSVP